MTATRTALPDVFGGGTGIVVVGAIVVVVLIVVVEVTGTIFWNMPTIGSLGTANDTVHAVAFTEKGVIDFHVPLTSSNGAMSEGAMLHGYGSVTFMDTLADVETLMLSELTVV